MTDLLISLGLGGVLSLSGVLLGAYIMYKAMRQQQEPHRGFFGEVPKGDVFSIDDWNADEDENVNESRTLPEDIQQRTNKFVEQFAERLNDGRP
jgi:hypothetical protein